MLLNPQTMTILGVLFCSTIVRSTFGFGDALLAMPILAVVVGLKTATPLVALVATTIALVILVRTRTAVELKSAKGLIISTLIGIPIGLFLIRGSYDTAMKLVLSAVIIGFALYSLVKPAIAGLRSERGAYLFGLTAGILGGAYNTNGPPVVIYGSLRGWKPLAFRATLQAYFFMTGWLIVAGHCAAGLWTTRVLTLYGLALPVVFLGIVAGSVLHRSIPEGKFDRSVHVLLLMVGVFLCANTIVNAMGKS